MDRGYLTAEYPSQFSNFHVPLYEHHSRALYTDANSSHLGSPYLHSTSLTSTSPPMTSLNDNISRTRTGRPIRTDSPHGSNTATTSATRSASPKRTRRGRSGKSKKDNVPHLTAPLSVITKDMNVPVRDMEIWVSRSTEVRRQEAERRKGYVTRPMNSFMLYRSAYAERTKAWCTENNHQIVSSVSGASWPMEPPEVRDFYNELAKIERVNHQAAHPEYKFSPAKPASKRKNAGVDSDGDSDNDPDGDWATTHRVRGTRSRTGRDASYPSRASVPKEQPIQPNYAAAANSFANAPEWSINNVPPARHLASRLLTSVYQGHYPNSQNAGTNYYGNMIPTHQQSMLSEFHYPAHSPLSSRVGTPSVLSNVALSQSFGSTSNGFVGLPGSSQNLLSMPGTSQQHGASHQDLPSYDGSIDPTLMPYNPHGMPTAFGIYGDVYGYRDAAQTRSAHDEQFGSAHPQQSQRIELMPEEIKYQPKEWKPDSNDDIGSTMATSEFDAYWATHTSVADNVGLNLGIGEERVPVPQDRTSGEESPDEKRRMLELFGEVGDTFNVNGERSEEQMKLDDDKSPKTA